MLFVSAFLALQVLLHDKNMIGGVCQLRAGRVDPRVGSDPVGSSRIGFSWIWSVHDSTRRVCALSL